MSEHADVTRGTGWGLQGRDAEATSLVDHFVHRGRPRVASAAILGPAGIGKTALAAEVSNRCDEAFSVLRAQATSAGRRIPFGALAQIIPAPIAEHTSASGMLASAADHLQRSGDEKPVLLCIDDAQELDDASLTLVDQLVRNDLVALLLTARTGSTTPDTLHRLWDDRIMRRIDLQNLDEVSAAACVRSVCDGPVDPPTLRRLFQVTEGNPLYLRELVEAARDNGWFAMEDGLWRLRNDTELPGRVIELIATRFDRLDPSMRAGLEHVAVAGTIPLADLEAQIGLDAVEAAERNSLIFVTEELGTPSTRPGAEDARRDAVRLAHPLYRETLLAQMPVTRRRSIQRQVADALINNPKAPGSALHHAALLRLECGDEVSPSLLEQAALYAHTCFDHDGAERLTRAVLATATDRPTRASMTRILANLLRWQGRPHEAEELLADLSLTDVDDTTTRARLAASRSENLFRGLSDADGARAVITEGKEGLSEEEAARLVAAEASLSLFAGDVTNARTRASAVLALDCSPFARSAAAVALSYALWRAGRFDDALASADFAEAIDDEAPGVLHDDPAATWIARSFCLIDRGDLEAAARTIDAGPRDHDISAVPAGIPWFELISASLAIARGLPVTAAVHARAAALAFAEAGDCGLEQVAWAGVARAEAVAGRPDVAADALDRAMSIDPGPFLMLQSELPWAEAWVRRAQGDRQSSIEAIDRAFDTVSTRGHTAKALEIATDGMRLGAFRRYAPIIIDLAPRVDGPLAPLLLRWAEASIANSAEGLLEIAPALAAQGAMLLATDAAATATLLFRRKKRQRDATRASMTGQKFVSECQGARTPAQWALDEPEPLTTREREIAELAATGRSSSDIADHLVLSTRTVDNHLQRIYRKVGVRSRRDLGRHLSTTAAG